MLTFHTRTLTSLSSYDISSHPKMIQLITCFIVSTLTRFINWLCTEHWLTLYGWHCAKDAKHCRRSHESVRARLREKEDDCFDFQSVWGVFLWVCSLLVCLPLHVQNDSCTFGSNWSNQWAGTLILYCIKHNKILGKCLVHRCYTTASILRIHKKGFSDCLWIWINPLIWLADCLWPWCYWHFKSSLAAGYAVHWEQRSKCVLAINTLASGMNCMPDKYSQMNQALPNHKTVK